MYLFVDSRPFLGMLSIRVTRTERFGWHCLINARVQEKTLAYSLPRVPIKFTETQLSWYSPMDFLEFPIQDTC